MVNFEAGFHAQEVLGKKLEHSPEGDVSNKENIGLQSDIVDLAAENEVAVGAKADQLANAIKSGATGTRLRQAMENIVLATAVAGGAANVEAANAPGGTSEAPQAREQRAEAEKPRLIRGVASDPALGQFTVEVVILGAKKDGTFGMEYSVVINGEQKNIQTSRRARTGNTVIELVGGMRIIAPSGYGAGSENPPTLTITDKNGNPISLKIEQQ